MVAAGRSGRAWLRAIPTIRNDLLNLVRNSGAELTEEEFYVLVGPQLKSRRKVIKKELIAFFGRNEMFIDIGIPKGVGGAHRSVIYEGDPMHDELLEFLWKACPTPTLRTTLRDS